jgi:hypothetical protein
MKLRLRHIALSAVAAVLLGAGASPSDEVYRVADVGKPGVPTLTPPQLSWISRIERTPYYKSRLQTLWFTTLRPAKGDPPLLVFNTFSTNRDAVEPNSHHLRAGFWVIGEPCNVLFIQGLGLTAMSDHFAPECESGRALVKP